MSFLQTVEADITKEWGEITDEISGDALIAWNAIKTIFLTLAPGQWTILKDIVGRANSDVTNGDYGDVVTDVLNLAAREEVAWVAQLGSEILTAVVAVLKTAAPATSQPTS